MKVLKIFSLIVLMFCTTIAKAQDTSQVITPDSTKLSWGKVYNDVKGAASAIGSALKVGAEHVYEILVHQQVVESVIYVIMFILCMIWIIFNVRWGKWLAKRFDKGDDADDVAGYIFGLVISGIGCAVLLGIVLAHIPNIVTGFVNPEYGAISEILDKIGG